jgi:hypothetical protein
MRIKTIELCDGRESITLSCDECKREAQQNRPAEDENEREPKGAHA